jgi:hypothetical protein
VDFCFTKTLGNVPTSNALAMKIALVHNPRAGNAMLEPNELRRRFENAGFDVLYASTKEKNWEKTLDKQFDRIVIAGDDGTLLICSFSQDRIPVTANWMLCGSQVNSGANGRSTCKSAEVAFEILRILCTQ